MIYIRRKIAVGLLVVVHYNEIKMILSIQRGAIVIHTFVGLENMYLITWRVVSISYYDLDVIMYVHNNILKKPMEGVQLWELHHHLEMSAKGLMKRGSTTLSW